MRKNSEPNGASNSRVVEGFAQHITTSEKKVEVNYGVDGITDRARQMALELGKAINGSTQEEKDRGLFGFQEIYEKEFTDLNYTVVSIEELNQYLNVDSKKVAFVELSYDIKDAVALTMIANGGRYESNLNASLKAANGVDVESAVGINGGLLAGLGEEMINSAIFNPDVVNVLYGFQAAFEGKNLEKGSEIALELLAKMDNRDPEVAALATYINSVCGGVATSNINKGGGANTDMTLIDLMSGEAEAPLKFKDFSTAVVNRKEFPMSPTQLPMWFNRPDLITKYSEYNQVGGKERWGRLISVVDAMSNWLNYRHTGVAQWNKEFSKLLDYPQLKDISAAKLTQMWNESPGFRLTAQTMFKDFFIQDKTFPDSNVFTIRMKSAKLNDTGSGDVKVWANDFSSYIENSLVPRLIDQGIPIEVAKMYAVAARVFMDVNFDKADSQREYNAIALDPCRSTQNPEEKIEQKGGAKIKVNSESGVVSLAEPEEDQQFGGMFGKFIQRMADLEGVPFVKMLMAAKDPAHYEYMYAPKHTALAWAEIQAVTIFNNAGDKERTSVARLLLEKDFNNVKRVDFGYSGDDGIYGGYQRDIAPIVDFFGGLYKGDIKVDVKKLETIEKVAKEISNQRTEMLKIQKFENNGPMMEKIFGARFVAMSIVASIPGELDLNRTVLLPDTVKDNMYDFVVDTFLKHLTGMDADFKEEVRNILHSSKTNLLFDAVPATNPKFLERKAIRIVSAANKSKAKSMGIL